MIIDSLTHVTPDGRWFSTAHDASVDRLLRELDHAAVDRALVIPLAGYIENDFVLDVCRRDARLIPGCSFDPATASDIARFRGSPFRVIKLHPRLHRYDPLDPRCLTALEELATWSEPMPVWLDTFFGGRGVAMRRTPVETACELADRFPSLQFVFLHGGGSQALQFGESLRDRPNATLDLSFTLLRYAGSSVIADLRWLLAHLDRRIIFGSDFPEYGIAQAFNALRDAGEGLAADKMSNVQGDNLARLLGIDR